MSIVLTRRVEALENRIGHQAVIVVRNCEACGQSLPFDDPGSLCGTHPRLAVPERATVVRVQFNDSKSLGQAR